MIIRDFKYGFRPHEEKVKNLLGKNPNIFKRFRMGRMGSMKMRVLNMSPQLNVEFEGNQDSVFGSIELRPKGIIIHLNKGIYRVAWMVPFYQLSIFKTDFWTIHGQGLNVKLHDDQWRNKAFFDKVLNQISNKSASHPLN